MGGSRFLGLRSARLLTAGLLVAVAALGLGACEDQVVEDPAGAPAAATRAAAPTEDPSAVPSGHRLLSLRFAGGSGDRLLNTGAVPLNVVAVTSDGETVRFERGAVG